MIPSADDIEGLMKPLIKDAMDSTVRTIVNLALLMADKMERGELQHPDGATALRAFAKALRQ